MLHTVLRLPTTVSIGAAGIRNRACGEHRAAQGGTFAERFSVFDSCTSAFGLDRHRPGPAADRVFFRASTQSRPGAPTGAEPQVSAGGSGTVPFGGRSSRDAVAVRGTGADRPPPGTSPLRSQGRSRVTVPAPTLPRPGITAFLAALDCLQVGCPPREREIPAHLGSHASPCHKEEQCRLPTRSASKTAVSNSRG